MRKSWIVAVALLLAPAVSQAKTLEDLLVEKGVITKAEAKTTTVGGPAKVYWNGGTRFEFPDSGFTSSIALFLVERYTFTDADEDFGGRNSSSFEQKRARIIISGTALDNEFSYYMQSDFVGTTDSTGKASPSLKDAYITWNACDWGNVKMGQYKTLVSRQFVTSDWQMLLPDRSITSDFFDYGRNQGVSASLWSEDKMFQGTAAMFNGDSDGEGENRRGVDTNQLGMVSLRVNPTGKMNPYQESDVEYTQDLATSIGATYAYGESKNTLDTDREKVKSQTFNIDANAKYQGFSFNGEFYWSEFNPQSQVGQSPVGFYLQSGYFLTPKKFEIAARYAYIDCKDGKVGGSCEGNDQLDEVTVGLNYYFWGHNLKAQLAWTWIGAEAEGAADPGDDENTNKWMFQMSSYF